MFLLSTRRRTCLSAQKMCQDVEWVGVGSEKKKLGNCTTGGFDQRLTKS